MAQLVLDLPETEQLTDRDRLHNRLAFGSVQPERKDNRDQDDLFAIHCRAAEINGDFGHVY